MRRRGGEGVNWYRELDNTVATYGILHPRTYYGTDPLPYSRTLLCDHLDMENYPRNKIKYIISVITEGVSVVSVLY